MNCKVMKCQSEATMVHQFRLPDAPVHEAPLCGLHMSLIKDGSEYLFPATADTPGGVSFDGQILMGEDLLGMHEWIVTDVHGVTATVRFANDPDDLGPVFTLAVRRRGDPHDSTISLVFRGEAGPKLVKLMRFSGLAGPDPS